MGLNTQHIAKIARVRALIQRADERIVERLLLRADLTDDDVRYISKQLNEAALCSEGFLDENRG